MNSSLLVRLLTPAVILLTCFGIALAQNPTDANIRSLQLRVRMYPSDFKAYDQLGAAYIQKGRETADASYYELAKAALDKSLARSDEQLAYYVAQAREVIDLSMLSQKQIIEEMQQLAGQRALAGTDAT